MIYTKDYRIAEALTEEIREYFSIKKEKILRPANLEEVEHMYQVGYTVPLGQTKWLFYLDNDNIWLTKAAIEKLIDTETAFYIIKTSDFKSYKILVSLLQSSRRVLNYTATYINRNWYNWLLNSYFFNQEKGYLIPEVPGLMKYIYNGYKMYPDKLLDIFDAITKKQIQTKLDVRDIAGPPNNTQEEIIIKLSSIEVKSEKSFKIQVKNRSTELLNLAEIVGVFTLRNYLIKTIKDFLRIKFLYLRGMIYNDLKTADEEKIPDLKQLRRYNYYVKDIKKLPSSRFILMLSILTKQKWYSELDIISFVYQYLIKIS